MAPSRCFQTCQTSNIAGYGAAFVAKERILDGTVSPYVIGVPKHSPDFSSSGIAIICRQRSLNHFRAHQPLKEVLQRYGSNWKCLFWGTARRLLVNGQLVRAGIYDE
jgi:hypothetical protein